VATKYLFADESGNFDFRCHTTFQGATRFFAVGTLLMEGEDKVQALRADLLSLRDDLIREGIEHHGPFHCTEDSQQVRDRVFEVLQRHDFTVDVTILEKAKAMPKTRLTDPLFYKYAWYFHFKNFARRYFKADDELMVVSAGLGTKKTKHAFRTAIEEVVGQCCPWKVKHKFGHWDSATDPALQAVDYVLWAVMRHVERGDSRSRDLVEDKIASVYDLWSVGRVYYYGPKAAKSA
jgi:hypothetical protein